LKVVVGGCGAPDGGMGMPDGGSDGGGMQCSPPGPVRSLSAQSDATSIAVTFAAPPDGVAPDRYQVRYQEGHLDVSDSNFLTLISAPEASASNLSSKITGLVPKTEYTIAVRGVSPCGTPSEPQVTYAITQQQQFVVLHGCFVATAAYGSELAGEVAALRRVRDARLLDNAAGRLFVAAYYGISPSLASAIAADAHLRALARVAIAPLVDWAKRLEPR